MSYRRLPGGKLDIRCYCQCSIPTAECNKQRSEARAVLDRFPDAIHPLIQMLLALNMMVVVLGPLILIGLIIARVTARAELSPDKPGIGPADEVTEGPTEDPRDSDGE